LNPKSERVDLDYFTDFGLIAIGEMITHPSTGLQKETQLNPSWTAQTMCIGYSQ